MAMDNEWKLGLNRQIEIIGKRLIQRNWMLATAESCTGGGVAYALTSMPGSSQWFDRGFVTYSNQSKTDMLSVQNDVIQSCGAVSKEVVTAMTLGALQHSRAHVSLAISGIAGPDGGTLNKPVGTVWFAWASVDVEPVTRCEQISGDRECIRNQAVSIALQGIVDLLTS